MRNDGVTARPVFVDRSGRRQRIAVALGSIVGMVLLTVLGVLTAGLFGASLTLPGLPDAGENGSAGPVATQRAVPRSTPAPSLNTAPGGAVTSPTAGPSTTRRHQPSQTPSHPKKGP
ncbi:MAG: hypothetical protein ACM30G_11475 [Micromonosporaceae bacterium]